MDVLLYPVLAAAAYAFSWWSYRNQTAASVWRITLIGLRGTALFIAAALLLDPAFTSYGEVETRRKVIFAVDNSESIAQVKGRYNGRADAGQTFEILQRRLEEKTRLTTWIFDDSVRTRPEGSPAFDGTATDIASVLERARQEYDLAALVLMTDGIVTLGKDPAFQLDQLGFPVFTAALGDSGRVEDVWLGDTETPETALTETAFTLTGYVDATGLWGRTVTVKLLEGGKVLQSRNLTLDAAQKRQPARFTVQQATEGLHTYTLSIDGVSGEYSALNNARSVTVDVRNGRIRVMHAVFDIHPDAGAVRDVISGDAAVRLYPYLMTGTGRWIGGAPRISPDTLEMLLISGYPNPQQLQAFNPFEGAWAAVPKMILAGPQSRPEQLQSNSWFPLRFSGFPDWRPVTPVRTEAASRHPVTKDLPGDPAKLKAVQGILRSAELKPGAQELLKTAFMGAEGGGPAVVLRTTGSYKESHVMLVGTSAWYLNPDLGARSFYELLMRNLFQWTSARPENSVSIVRPSKPVFSASEPVVFEADLRNESGEPADGASVQVSIEQSGLGSFSFRRTAPGRYTASAGRLTNGSYRYKAEVSIPGTSVLQFSGTFDVVDQNAEMAVLIRNQALLNRMAAQSGGLTLEFDQAAALADSLEARGLLKPSVSWEEERFQVRTHWVWLAAVVLLLAAEWLVRKKFALP